MIPITGLVCHLLVGPEIAPSREVARSSKGIGYSRITVCGGQSNCTSHTMYGLHTDFERLIDLIVFIFLWHYSEEPSIAVNVRNSRRTIFPLPFLGIDFTKTTPPCRALKLANLLLRNDMIETFSFANSSLSETTESTTTYARGNSPSASLLGS